MALLYFFLLALTTWSQCAEEVPKTQICLLTGHTSIHIPTCRPVSSGMEVRPYHDYNVVKADRDTKTKFTESIIESALQCFQKSTPTFVPIPQPKTLCSAVAGCLGFLKNESEALIAREDDPKDCEWSARVDFGFPWAQHAYHITTEYDADDVGEASFTRGSCQGERQLKAMDIHPTCSWGIVHDLSRVYNSGARIGHTIPEEERDQLKANGENVTYFDGLRRTAFKNLTTGTKFVANLTGKLLTSFNPQKAIGEAVGKSDLWDETLDCRNARPSAEVLSLVSRGVICWDIVFDFYALYCTSWTTEAAGHGCSLSDGDCCSTISGEHRALNAAREDQTDKTDLEALLRKRMDLLGRAPDTRTARQEIADLAQELFGRPDDEIIKQEHLIRKANWKLALGIVND